MFNPMGPQHSPQQDLLYAKQVAEGRYTRLQKIASRRAQLAQLDGEVPHCGGRIRNLSRSLMQRKSAGH